jgi:hypothetical protein
MGQSEAASAPSATNSVGDLFTKCGHLYVTNTCYVHLHFYVKEPIVAQYLANILGARVAEHRRVYDVVVSKRAKLLRACERIIQYPLSEGHKRALTLAIHYARATDTSERRSMALQLRVLTSSTRT